MLDRLAKVINISKDYLDDTHRIISNKPKKEQEAELSWTAPFSDGYLVDM